MADSHLSLDRAKRDRLAVEGAALARVSEGGGDEAVGTPTGPQVATFGDDHDVITLTRIMCHLYAKAAIL